MILTYLDGGALDLRPLPLPIWARCGREATSAGASCPEWDLQDPPVLLVIPGVDAAHGQ